MENNSVANDRMPMNDANQQLYAKYMQNMRDMIQRRNDGESNIPQPSAAADSGNPPRAAEDMQPVQNDNTETETFSQHDIAIEPAITFDTSERNPSEYGSSVYAQPERGAFDYTQAEYEAQKTDRSLYAPDYLKTQIGKFMRIEFLVGDQLLERSGVLTDVGKNYILMRTTAAKASFVCDLECVKFATIFEPPYPRYIGMMESTIYGQI